MSRTRRQALKDIAMSVTLAGVPPAYAQHVHEHAAAAKKKAGGVYKPKHFNAHEYRTVTVLAALIVPADEVSGSAVEAGAQAFIDLIAANNPEIGLKLRGGLAWLDRWSEERTGKSFASAAANDQTAMLDILAFRKNDAPEVSHGIVFFDWMRRLTTDAFYTSPIGVKDLGYQGNKGATTFQVPEAALQYALKRSPLG